jgi:cysteinyl-tRNA synthetase
MNEDLNTPKAIAVIHELVTTGNQSLDQSDLEKAKEIAASVRKMLEILGLDPQGEHWTQGQVNDRAESSLAILIERMLDTRAQARASKDFATSDRVRDDLKSANISIEDTVNGARWTFMEEDK